MRSCRNPVTSAPSNSPKDDVRRVKASSSSDPPCYLPATFLIYSQIDGITIEKLSEAKNTLE